MDEMSDCVSESGGIIVGVGEKRRKRKIGADLSERDLELMLFCWDHGLVVRRQVRRWILNRFGMKSIGVSKTIQVRTLNYLRACGFIEEKKTGIAECPEAISLTQKGVALLIENGLIENATPKPNMGETDSPIHNVMVTDVRLQFQSLIPESIWLSERHLRLNTMEAIPDGVLCYWSKVLKRFYRIAVEVELTQKSRTRYDKKFDDYSASDNNLVVYFYNNPSIAQTIHDSSRDRCQIVYTLNVSEFLTKGADVTLTSFKDQFVFKERLIHVRKKQ